MDRLAGNMPPNCYDNVHQQVGHQLAVETFTDKYGRQCAVEALNGKVGRKLAVAVFSGKLVVVFIVKNDVNGGAFGE